MAEINPKDYILVRDKDSNLYLAKQRTLQNNNWESQIRKLAKRKGNMSEIRDFLDLRDLLDSRRSAFDGTGTKINSLEKKSLLDEMVGIKSPWREEYFGNRFFTYNGNLYMESEFRVINDKVRATNVREIYPKVMEDGWTSFKYFDENGLATKLKGREVYFSSPIDGAVAVFYADSSWAYLFCCGGPSGSCGGLGVREARENFEV